MVLVYTEKYTPRVKYIFEHIFRDILKVEVSFTNKIEVAEESVIPVICYSRVQKVPNSFTIEPNGLLFSKGIKEIFPEVVGWNNTKIFFKTSSPDFDLPFDLFSAAFYLITRYEEYENSDLDEHGRYKAENSLAFRNDFLDEPLVDQWAYLLEDLLIKRFPDFKKKEKSRFRFCPTVDIDHVYKFRSKFLCVNLFRMAQKLFKRDWGGFKFQLRVLLHLEEDPFFNVSYIVDIHNKNGVIPVFFLHVGPRGKYDGYSFYHPYYRIKKIFYLTLIVGFHPSYSVDLNIKKLIQEKRRLENLTKVKVQINRFHFLKFSFPQSFQMLEQIGITSDYSLGYSHYIGFRASTCTPFYFYDLVQDRISSLKLHPLVIMDVTLKKYMGKSSEELFDIMSEYAEKIKEVNGEFVSLFHNESLSDDNFWSGWREQYQKAIRYISLLEIYDKEEALEKSR